MMADGGANGHIVNDLSLFSSYAARPCQVQQVSGASANCPGWGIVFIQVPDTNFPIIPLWPCYYMPHNPQNTLSQQALKQYNHFQRVSTESLDHILIQDCHGYTTQLKSIPEYHKKSLLDYVEVTIVKPSFNSDNQSIPIPPSFNKGIFSKLAHNISYEALHRPLSHICEKKLTSMCKLQTITGLPKRKPKRHHHACICTICIITKGKNRAKGKLIDTTNINVGNLLHMDITFFDVTSIRGFNCSINIIDAKSRKLWGFLSSAKRLPLRIFKYFLHALTKEGKDIHEIRIDEEGAIARSAEFTNMIIEDFPGIKINTTGGYASWLNGKIERPHETIKNGTRATLYDAGRDNTFWCYASTDVIRKYNCTLHSSTGDCPDFLWYGIRPSIHQLLPWGCIIYPHTHDTKALAHRRAEGYYFGITNSNSLVEWFDPCTQSVKHCNTASFDEFRTHIGTDPPMPGALAIGGQPLAETDLPALTLNTSDHPFFDEPPQLFQVPLPFKGRALGLEIGDCDYYLLPFITKSKQGFPFHKHLPASFRNNSWIVSIDNKEPYSKENAVDILKQCQLKNTNYVVNIYLAKRGKAPTKTRLNENRHIFKQVEYIPSKIVTTKSAAFLNILPSANKLIFSPIRPNAPQHMGDFAKSNLKSEWKESMLENYEKMNTSGTFSAPILRKDLPPHVKIL